MAANWKALDTKGVTMSFRCHSLSSCHYPAKFKGIRDARRQDNMSKQNQREQGENQEATQPRTSSTERKVDLVLMPDTSVLFLRLKK